MYFINPDNPSIKKIKVHTRQIRRLFGIRTIIVNHPGYRITLGRVIAKRFQNFVSEAMKELRNAVAISSGR